MQKKIEELKVSIQSEGDSVLNSCTNVIGVLEKQVSKLNISLSELQSSVYALQGKVHSLSERTGSGGGGQIVHQIPTLPVTSSSPSISSFIPKKLISHTHSCIRTEKHGFFFICILFSRVGG